MIIKCYILLSLLWSLSSHDEEINFEIWCSVGGVLPSGSIVNPSYVLGTSSDISGHLIVETTLSMSTFSGHMKSKGGHNYISSSFDYHPYKLWYWLPK